MTDSEYEQCWQLHLWVADGETLGVEEEQLYRTGLELLEREAAAQLSSADFTLLRSLRARLQTSVQLQNNLLQQSAKLDKKIEELEYTYQQLTGLDLAVDVYAIR